MLESMYTAWATHCASTHCISRGGLIVYSASYRGVHIYSYLPPLTCVRTLMCRSTRRIRKLQALHAVRYAQLRFTPDYAGDEGVEVDEGGEVDDEDARDIQDTKGDEGYKGYGGEK